MATLTDTAGLMKCRHCGVPIRRPADGTFWIDRDEGWDSCEDTDRSHEPAADCHVVEQIVPWSQVTAGDLVLYKDRFETVTEVIADTSQPAYVALRFTPSHRFNGQRVVWVLRNNHTAVTRYVETVYTAQDAEEQ